MNWIKEVLKTIAEFIDMLPIGVFDGGRWR